MNTQQPIPPGHSRAAILDQLYQRINSFDDATLETLYTLIAEGGQFEFVEDTPAPRKGVGRRAFLTALLTGSAALAGAGATYVWLSQKAPPLKATAAPTLAPTLQGQPLPTMPPVSPTPGPEVTLTALRDELAAARNDELTLRAELNSLREANAQITTTLQAREADVVYLQQVVGLYAQMEAVGLDSTVTAGISPVHLSLTAVGVIRSLLQAGVQQAANLLETVEVQAPAIANGLIWLETQIDTLAGALQTLEDTLSGLVEPVQPVANQIGEFINKVLDILPFGVGDNLRAGLQAVGAILTHIPELVASINPLVITPLRQWVSPEDEGGLIPEVITPLQTGLVAPARQMVDDTAALETTFNDDLKTPVEAAITARAALRADLHRLTGATS